MHLQKLRMNEATVSTRSFMELKLSEAAACASIYRLHGQMSTLRAQMCNDRTEILLMRGEIERMQGSIDDLQSANSTLKASGNGSGLRSEACQCACSANENIDDIAPPPSSASGGCLGGIVEKDAEEFRPSSMGRAFIGDGSNRSTLSRWKKYAKSVLARFSPEQFRITISGLYAELLDEGACLSSALSDALQRNPDTFEELLPTGFMTERLLKCQEDFVASMTQHWSRARCLDIKFRNWLSREKYDQVRRSLSSTFLDGVWVHNSHNGTLFPALRSRYSLDKVCRVIAKESGLRKFAGGLGASVDIRTLVQVWFMSYCLVVCVWVVVYILFWCGHVCVCVFDVCLCMCVVRTRTLPGECEGVASQGSVPCR